MKAVIKQLTANSKAMAQFGFTRAPEHDFEDDGNHFKGYMWKGKLPLTQLYSDGSLYLSVRDDYVYSDLPYSFWKKYEGSKIGDEYNGVTKEVDLEHLNSICEKIEADLNQARKDFKALEYPDMSNQIQSLKNSLAKGEMVLSRNLNWFEMNLSKSGIESAFEDYKRLKEAMKRDEGRLAAMLNNTLPKREAYEISQRAEYKGDCEYYAKELNELIDQKDYSWYYIEKKPSMK